MNRLLQEEGESVTRKFHLVLAFAILTAVMYPIAAGAYASDVSEAVFSFEVPPDVSTQAEQTKKVQDVFSVEIIRTEKSDAAYTGKRVLIYHTHTYESYQKTENDLYQEIEKWRTSDEEHNIVAVGDALSKLLLVKGINVVHDKTAFEPPSLEQAYDRSLAMLEMRKQSGEEYDLYIDLHRDAVASTSTIKRTINIGGEEVARFMVLVGKGTTGGYAQKPDWESNLSVAARITDSLNSMHTGLARDVKIKTGRFNQHVSNRCILIECGMNSNTLDQVLAGVPYLADAIAEVLGDE